MSQFQGLLGLLLIYALCILISHHRGWINWRTLGIGLVIQIAFAFLVLKWEPGNQALNWFASQIAKLIGYTSAGEKTVINEFVAFASFGPQIPNLDPKTVLITTFALSGFANFGSIAIQIGAFGALAPELRGDVASFGLLALLAGSLTASRTPPSSASLEPKTGREPL